MLFAETSTSQPLIIHENLLSSPLKGQIFDTLYMVCQEKMYTINSYLNPLFNSRCIGKFNLKARCDLTKYNELFLL